MDTVTIPTGNFQGFFMGGGAGEAERVAEHAAERAKTDSFAIAGAFNLDDVIFGIARRREIRRMLAASWSLYPDTVFRLRELIETGRIGGGEVWVGTSKAREAIEAAFVHLGGAFRVYHGATHCKIFALDFSDGDKLTFCGSSNFKIDEDTTATWATVGEEAYTWAKRVFSKFRAIDSDGGSVDQLELTL